MSFVTMVAINIQFVSTSLITTILLFEMPSMLLWLVNIPPITISYVAPWALQHPLNLQIPYHLFCGLLRFIWSSSVLVRMPFTLVLMQFYHNASDFFNEYELKTCILLTKSLSFNNDLGLGVLRFTISQTTPSSRYGDITTTNNNYELFS